MASVVLPELDEPFRKMTFPVPMPRMVSGSRVNDNSSMDSPTESPPPDLQEAIDRLLPIRNGLSVLAEPISDRLSELHADEAGEVDQAIDRRRQEFATGRVLARQAMQALGIEAGPILRGDRRQPIWPAGAVGSITHAGQLAVAAIGRAERLRAVGLDLELTQRVDAKLHGKLFTAAEQALIAGADPRMAGLMFSAKEAGYKATYPLAGRFIGFKEAEVDVDWPERRFRFRYIGDHEPNRIMEQGEGYFLFCERYVLSLVIIPERNEAG